MSKLTNEELHEICNLVIKLTELRQNGCNHLCIENFAPELMAKILEVYRGRAIVEYGAHDLIKVWDEKCQQKAKLNTD